MASAICWTAGSSPLARGLQTRRHARPQPRGIIPARAGFTLPPVSVMWPRWDHPRSRGVYAEFLRHCGVKEGSSPLARGLPPAWCRGQPIGGIIPARAGFTPTAWNSTITSGDHPRSRGVYITVAASYLIRHGSSPLARGLHEYEKRDCGDVGIIPARAGFTSLGFGGGVLVPDHPRSRGVYVAIMRSTTPGRGSSPLARGLQGEVTHARRRRRIIPARAGFTPE